MVHKIGLISLREDDPMLSEHLSEKPQWDINDTKLPVPNGDDHFQLWPDGHSRYVYSATNHEEARRHISGWAMRNTNNHNVNILKKSCLGVLLCSNSCRNVDSGKPTTVRPAICDKARKKQCGKPCPNTKCSGILVLTPCRGHCGYPVTHFWRQYGPYLYFQSKGTHDHPQPELKIPSSHKKIIKDKEGRYLRKRGRVQERKPSCSDPRLPKISGPMCSCPPFECLCGKQFAPTAVPPFPTLAEEFGKKSQYESSMFLHAPLFTPYQHNADTYSPYATFSDMPPLYLPRPNVDFFSASSQNHPSNLSSGSLFDQLAATSRPSPNQSLHTMSNATSFSSPPPLQLNLKSENCESHQPNLPNSTQNFQREDSVHSSSPTNSPNQDNICAYLVNTLNSTFKSEGFNPISPPPFPSASSSSNDHPGTSAFRDSRCFQPQGFQTPEFKPTLSSSPNPHNSLLLNTDNGCQIEELKLKTDFTSQDHQFSPPAKSAFLPYNFEFIPPASGLSTYPQFVDYSNFYSYSRPVCNFPKPTNGFEQAPFPVFHGSL